MDRAEWHMTPQTVNTYYNPAINEVVFPAAILQPPFFTPGADDAVNYAAIGAVIGHEIGHGFDDQGSAFDGTGKVEDWWTEADREAFEARTKALIAQYDAYRPASLVAAARQEGTMGASMTVAPTWRKPSTQPFFITNISSQSPRRAKRLSMASRTRA